MHDILVKTFQRGIKDGLFLVEAPPQEEIYQWLQTETDRAIGSETLSAITLFYLAAWHAGDDLLDAASERGGLAGATFAAGYLIHLNRLTAIAVAKSSIEMLQIVCAAAESPEQWDRELILTATNEIIRSNSMELAEKETLIVASTSPYVLNGWVPIQYDLSLPTVSAAADLLRALY